MCPASIRRAGVRPGDESAVPQTPSRVRAARALVLTVAGRW